MSWACTYAQQTRGYLGTVDEDVKGPKSRQLSSGLDSSNLETSNI